MTPFDTLDLPLEPVSKLLQGDVSGAVTSPFADIGQGVTPMIKAPFELATGRSTFTGQEITDWPSWLASQFGPSRSIDKAVTGGTGTTGREALNSLLGLPIQIATADRQEGEFRRRQDAEQAKNRQLKLSKLRDRFSDFDNFTEAKREALMRGVKSPPNRELQQQRRYLTQILGQ